MSAVTPFDRNNITLFQPNQISGLALWLDAADSATVLTSGANVTAWNDKSGNGRNATAFGVGSPTYSSNSIVFTGSHAFATTLSSLLPNQSGFAIIKYSSTAKIDILSLTRTGASAPAGIQQIIENNVQYITTYGGATIATGATLTQNTMLLYAHTFSATTNAFMYLNGSQTGQTTGPYSFSGTGTINIGGYDAGPGEGFIGSMNEILLFNVVLTTNQRQQIESYLAYKWNLQTSLPTTHPYYASPYNAYPPFTNINQNLKFAYPVLPSEIAGLSLWLDAADSSTLFQNTAGTTPVTNSSQIQLWKDKSSSANNATNSQTVMTYNSSGLNGLPAISFPGTQTTGFSLSGALLPNGSSDATYFFVLNKNNGATQVFFTHGGATQLKQFYASGGLIIDRAGSGLISDGTSIINLNTIVSCTQTSLTNGVNAWRNGNPFLSGPATITWNVNTTAAWLGSGETGGTLYKYAGVISEVIVYNNALTTNQRQAVEAYLAYKWGLQSNLPVTHPYYRNLFLPNVALSAPTSIGNYQYSPRAISGLALWLDAADSASVSRTGVNVTDWIDKSGNGYSITAAVGLQPTYANNAITFNGSQAFSTTYTSSPGAESIFIVFIYTTSVGGVEYTLLQPNTSGGRQFYIYNNTLTTAKSGIIGYNIGTTIINTRTLVESTNTGTSLNHFINGTNVGSSVVTAYSGANTTSIGGTKAGVAGLIGSIHEVVIFSSVLTTNQRQQIEGYLAWKWGLQKSLPSNHPFYLIPQG